MVRGLTSYNHLRDIFLFIIVVGLNFAPAHAAPVTLKTAHSTKLNGEEVDYRMQWMGLTLGRAKLIWQETADHYDARITITTSGVARLFNKQTRVLETNGVVIRTASSTSYIPHEYHNHVRYKNKERDMRIMYNKQGIESSYVMTPPDDRRWRPEVADADRDKAFDIMTAAMYAYEQIMQQKKSFDFKVFDARRLSGIHYVLSPDKNIIRYVGTRTADGGYTDKELKEIKETEDVPVTIEMGDKQSRFVTRVFAKTVLGTVEAVREHHRVLLNPMLTQSPEIKTL
jgi:hypothetical protein